MFIYCIENTKNNKCYIGQTTKTLSKRKDLHKYRLDTNNHFNSHLQNSWNKYGEDSFRFFELEKCNTLEELNERERKWIKILNLNDRTVGYNIDLGGKNVKRSKETKQKLSKLLKEYYKNNQGPRKGEKHKQSSKDKMGTTVYKYDLEGNYLCKYKSMKRAYKDTGCDVSQISKCCRGKGRTSKNFRWSYDKKKKLDELEEINYLAGKCKPVLQYDLDGNFIKEFPSVRDAGKELNICRQSISKCCNDIFNTYKGFLWRFK